MDRAFTALSIVKSGAGSLISLTTLLAPASTPRQQCELTLRSYHFTILQLRSVCTLRSGSSGRLNAATDLHRALERNDETEKGCKPSVHKTLSTLSHKYTLTETQCCPDDVSASLGSGVLGSETWGHTMC